MTVRLELDPDVEARITHQATASGVPVEEYLKTLIEQAVQHDAPGAATRALFAKWSEEDKTDDPAEIEARNREFEEFKAAMNANRPGQRPLFP